MVVPPHHESYPGIGHIKSFARRYVWWPCLDTDFENKVRQCSIICIQTQKLPPKIPIQPWEWAEKPWIRIHSDHAGPNQGKTILVMVDTHSQWTEAHIVPSTSMSATVEKLHITFATHGLPKVIVSDNIPAFTSSEFKHFIQSNRTIHDICSIQPGFKWSG